MHRLLASGDAWKCLSQALECDAACPAQKLLEPPLETAINHSCICLLRLQSWRVRGSPPSWVSSIQSGPPEEYVPLWSLQVTPGFQTSSLALQDTELRRRRGWGEGVNMVVQQRKAKRGAPNGKPRAMRFAHPAQKQGRRKRRIGALLHEKGWGGGGQAGSQMSGEWSKLPVCGLPQPWVLFTQYKSGFILGKD